MYVCVCKQISDSTIKELLSTGISADKIIEDLNLGSGCASCLPYFHELVLDYNETLLMPNKV